MREEASFLNYVADAPAQADGIPVRGRAALNDHLPSGGEEKPVNQF
jgi:hypothetical protein